MTAHVERHIRLSLCRRRYAGSSPTVVCSRVYQPRPHRSPSAVIIALLLLLGGVDCNPGPSASPSSSVGLLNARSACNKAPLIHDVITGHSDPERDMDPV